jgi:hypothetical protein
VRELALACALRGAERESRTFLRVTIEQAGAAILAAANRLGIVLHDHAAVIARAKAAVQRLDTELAKARERGDLRSFNFEYRRRRLAGARLPPYGIMLDRYRAALASSIAGNTPPWEIITVVFGERS